MAQLITLEHFGACERHYHVYMIQNSHLAHESHYHNYFQVCFVRRGEITHCDETQSVHLGPGDAFIIPPGFTHSLHFDSAYSEIYSLVFETSLFHPGFPQSNVYRFLTSLQNASHTVHSQDVRLCIALDSPQRKSIQYLMECLLLQQDAGIPPELSAAPSLISSILYLLAQGYYQQPQNTHQLKELANYTHSLLQCIEYIDHHYREPLSLAAISKQFGLSRSAFCSIFPQFTGLPLRQYIARKRISEAQMLIRSRPELRLGQIAASVGFDDISSFYRNFLKVTGMSPSKYRELHVPKD